MVHRVAVLDSDLCHSDKCGLECIRDCPVNINGEQCIVLGEEKLAVISESLCIGCGICVKVCPFEAITILNLGEELKQDKIHQYGINSFRLYRLPTPRKGQVVGLVGRNGVGKSTALQILSGQLIPNLGDYEKEPSWDKFLILPQREGDEGALQEDRAGGDQGLAQAPGGLQAARGLEEGREVPPREGRRDAHDGRDGEGARARRGASRRTSRT